MFEIGEQVAYVPLHAKGNLAHEDVEFGFVTSVKGDLVFCRYWRKGSPGMLRTTANSEGTPASMLVHKWSVRQGVVNDTLRLIGAVDAN